jgi:uncharacterized delta-60 repeat protein
VSATGRPSKNPKTFVSNHFYYTSGFPANRPKAFFGRFRESLSQKLEFPAKGPNKHIKQRFSSVTGSETKEQPMFFHHRILKSLWSRTALAGLFAATVILFGAVGVRAQTPGDTDPTFGAGLAGATTRERPLSFGTGGQVRVIVPLADGRVLIGGNFIEIGGTPQIGIARLNADGSLDTTFGAGQTGVSGAVQGLGVYAIAVQPDGKIIIGGQFLVVNGVIRGNLARLNADGTLDTSFGNGLSGVTGANSSVDAVAVQPDGKILIGGFFSTLNGVEHGAFARLNADGTLDAAFSDSLFGVGRLTTIALQSDGKILIGGAFASVAGVTRGSVARLNADGTLDTTFGNGLAGANGVVQDLALQPDGKVIIGGNFNRVNGTLRHGVARVNADGTLDTTFGIAVNLAGQAPQSVAVQSDGKVIVGGNFNQIGGVTATNLVRLTATGTLDASFPQNLLSLSEAVNAVAVQDDGRVLVGGIFGQIGGVARGQMARLSAVGVVDETFVPGLGRAGLVNAIALQSDGKMLVGGDFDVLNGLPRGRVGRLNPDGTTDTTFGAAQTGPEGATVRAVALQADGKILIGGQFNQINGAARGGVARLNADGTLDTSFGNGLSGTFDTARGIGVYTILPLTNGQILVGGYFGTFNGVATSCIVRLNADGSLDSTFGAGVTIFGGVRAIVSQPDGRLLVAGRFGFTMSPNDLGLIRLNADGTLDATFPSVTLGASITAGVGDGVGALILQPDGKIFIGGNFISVNGAPRSAIARINADGTLDTGFANDGTGPNQRVNAAVRQSDGKFIIGGEFTSVAGQARSKIARLNADGTFEPTFGNGLSGPTDGLSPFTTPSLLAVVLQPDGKPVVGGRFNFINDVFHCGIARLVNPASCPTISVEPANPTLPAATVGANYPGVSFLGSGGTGPYGLTLTGGSLPPGMNFSSGAVVGTPTASGTFNFTVTATETLSGCSGSREYSLTVNPATVGTPVLVNDRVSLVITGQSVEAATCPGYAADVVLTGTLTNTGTVTITDPFFEVIELQAASGVTPALPYRLLTATGASCGSGGLVGSVQPVGGAGFVLNPGQSVPVTFRLALPTMGRLRFFVNVRGVLPVISQSLKAVAKRPVRVLNDLEITAVGEKSLRNR